VQPAFVAVSAAAHRLQAPLQFATVAGPAAPSAGLALLVDWLANARAHHKTLHYAQPPPALLALARLSDVERLLAG
jgi:ABC-type transporter Mla MlaB component